MNSWQLGDPVPRFKNNEDEPMSEEQAKKLLAMLSKEEKKLLNDLLISLEQMRQPSVVLHELSLEGGS